MRLFALSVCVCVPARPVAPRASSSAVKRDVDANARCEAVSTDTFIYIYIYRVIMCDYTIRFYIFL